MADVFGDFEIHLTVSSGADSLATFASGHGVKFTHIVLDRGDEPSQPMITIRSSGTLAEQHDLVRAWQRRLGSVSLYPNRVKIEAAPDNDGVPHSDEAAASEPGDRYFEHHLKLVLPDASAARLTALTHLVVPHGARLSRNARRRRADGNEERFVTQRCHEVGRTTARERLDALTVAVRDSGHEITRIEQEYVVFDSAGHLDSGWLTDGQHATADLPSARRQ